MLERLFLAGTVTCLLYLSLQLGQSSVTPTGTEQTASRVNIEHSSGFNVGSNTVNFTVAQK
ncbi:hypothetical protein VB715_04350 [Crocosphaera sp. UHCC 0190]|uniref:hypothetical protein n=1 Tax=Crocosphaera sp. UHCC 0190 TaxID=3110246 RepID=UPI002B20625C|nr:hypothetical protein [Crocosphaera sp. UHCC 0190]MEA5508988.1 hypothetical protein [Crocosphaera sp. UHCC 0190]